jgi:hypothetical protein
MQEKNLEYKNLVYCYAWIQIKEEEEEEEEEGSMAPNE